MSRSVSASASTSTSAPLSVGTSLSSSDNGGRPYSLWDHLVAEVSVPEGESDAIYDAKRERIYNFLHIPMEIEKLMMFGIVVCLDAFLHTFTILPLRIAFACYQLIARLTNSSISSPSLWLSPSQRRDLYKGALVAIGCMMLQSVDVAQLYHSVRGQSVMKLYVIFNTLEIFDKMFCSFGQDIVESLYSTTIRSDVGLVRTSGLFLLSCIYIFVHSMILYYQMVTLNVAINSYQTALLTLLISNQFVEIKSSVFKRFEKENLFQLSCSDIVERFQLVAYLFIISLHNLVELTGPDDEMTAPIGSGAASASWLSSFSLWTLFTPILAVYGTEILVDWLKHAFITKFNLIRPEIYGRYIDILCRDLQQQQQQTAVMPRLKFSVERSLSVARRIGFANLPIAVVFI
ncbi:DUF747-domain-containing protein, partial [Ramicandelaber brevisporus]